MATCKIQNLKPICDYNIEGIEAILLLDSEDFGSFEFEGEDLYSNCLVISVEKDGNYIEIATPNSAKYSSTLQGDLYTHTLETFIDKLTAEFQSELHLATKRDYLIFFKTKAGTYHTFGYKSNITLSYSNQTAESSGSIVTLTGPSIYPLFEVTVEAMTDETAYGISFIPDFDLNTYCIHG